jgi:hypothetical protein
MVGTQSPNIMISFVALSISSCNVFNLGYNELGYDELGYDELGYNEHPTITNKVSTVGWFQ